MRFAITSDYREFFSKNNFIELEGLLPLDQVAILKSSAEETIARRLRVPVEKLKGKKAPEIYQAGYDLWRESAAIKKISHKHAFATLASELTQLVPLRYGFDQYFSTANCAGSPYDVPFSLQDISCIRPLAGAVLLPLQDLDTPPSFFPMPLKAGNALFLSPSYALPWPQLFSTPGLCFFMIVYTPERALFCPDSHDPHAVALKKLGYVFNDNLNDALHPIILRRN